MFFKIEFVPRPEVVARYIIFFLFPLISFSQSVENKFIDALINNRENVAEFIDSGELERSSRLGIEYTDVKYKFLISFDIPEEIKIGFRTGKYNYSLQTMQLEDSFTVIILAIPASSYLRKFYFLNDKFVPPSRYFSRNWEAKQSKYFNFRLSEPKYFNDYCIKRLDDFVDLVADTLGFTDSEKMLLEMEKIDYILCVDENDVEKVTGYKSKGQAVLAYDEIVTAYQTHFHEVAHLLINYKLKSLGLYTLPFFMEGFAAAMGGRGGMAPRVITDIGIYLQKSGFMTYDSILTYDEFYSQDATITYALSGLYNSFLISQMEAAEYLNEYKKFNGNIDFVKSVKYSDVILQTTDKFNTYLNIYEKNKIMYVDDKDTIKPSINIKGAGGSIAYAQNYYKFFINDLLFISSDQNKNVVYSKFIPTIKNSFGDSGKTSYKYCITADSVSVRIFNLFNDELIYNYNKNFSLSGIKIPVFGVFPYTFFIRKDVFDNDFDEGVRLEGDYR